MSMLEICTPCDERQLRKLRLHHWKLALGASQEFDSMMKNARETRSRTKRNQFDVWCAAAHQRWILHIGFVQTLNQFFSIEDTAEKDVERANL